MKKSKHDAEAERQPNCSKNVWQLTGAKANIRLILTARMKRHEQKHAEQLLLSWDRKQNGPVQNQEADTVSYKSNDFHTDRVVKFCDAGVNQVIAFTPVHLGAASLQLVPKNQINVTHVGRTERSGRCCSVRMKTIKRSRGSLL